MMRQKLDLRDRVLIAGVCLVTDCSAVLQPFRLIAVSRTRMTMLTHRGRMAVMWSLHALQGC